jgi:limonene-1,2-epoxide hydrolase
MSHATLERFYTAFQRLDGAAMQACYAPDARFDDPAFSLRGAEQVGAMWRMLCAAAQAQGGEAWRLSFQVGTDGRSARWEAWYRFSATGRAVHNRIEARFSFDEQGRILTHQDQFDFWRWSRQALGLPGWLMGWSDWLRQKVRSQAAKNLARYQAKTG